MKNLLYMLLVCVDLTMVGMEPVSEKKDAVAATEKKQDVEKTVNLSVRYLCNGSKRGSLISVKPSISGDELEGLIVNQTGKKRGSFNLVTNKGTVDLTKFKLGDLKEEQTSLLHMTAYMVINVMNKPEATV